MAKKKSTKKALLTSVLALTLSSSMLVGTTFAWFTDSVTSTGNKIVAGTLKVDLELLDKNGSWNSIKESKAPIFNYDNWEPGYTDVKVLKVENEGTLALKWKAKFVSDEELTALANVIDVYVNPSESELAYPTDFAEVESSYKHVGTVADFVNTIEQTTYGTLKADGETGDEAYLGIALKMQESAGNEYQNMSLGDFDIQIVATQLAYEEDSFGPDYDEIAFVSSAKDLTEAITAGKDVMLTGDIDCDATNTITVADDADIILDLNGHKISGTSSESGKNRALFTVKGEMSVIGDGTVSMIYTGSNMGWNNLSAPFSVESGVLTLDEGVSVMNFGGTDMAYAVDVNTTLGETVLNVNGATLYSTYIGVRIFNNHSTAKGTVNYNDGIIYGAKNGYDIWAQLMSQPAENAVVNIAENISYTTEDKSGTMYYIKSTESLVSNYAGLVEAVKKGGKIAFVDDITVDEWIMFSETLNISSGEIISVDEINVTIDGNGHALTVNSIESAGNGNRLFFDATNLNISNLTINVNCAGGGICLTSGVIENVVFNYRGNCIFPGDGNVTVKNCEFNTKGQPIYYEIARDNLTIINNIFNVDNGANVVILRGAETFTGNIVNSGRTVNIVSNTATVSGNVFNCRVKLYKEGQNLSGNIFEANAYIDIEDGINSVDLSGNYWGGSAPSSTQIPAEISSNVTVNNYYTTYVDGELGGLN